MQWNRSSVRDPVCGMHLDPSKAITRTVQGRIFYFCEEECAKRFLERAGSTQSGLKEVSARVDSIQQASSTVEAESKGISERRAA